MEFSKVEHYTLFVAFTNSLFRSIISFLTEQFRKFFQRLFSLSKMYNLPLLKFLFVVKIKLIQWKGSGF